MTTAESAAATCAGHAVLGLGTPVCHTPPGNREITLDSVTDLLASVSEHGQLVPGIVYPRDDCPGEFWVADGNRRLLVARITNSFFRAVALEAAPDEAELIRLKLTLDANSKAFDKSHVAAEVFRYMQLTGCDQATAARVFGFSQSYVSKLVAPYRAGCDELLEALKKGWVLSAATPCLASLPHEEQRRVLPKVVREGGRPLLTREAVEAVVAELKQPGGKPKTSKLTLPLGDGVVLTVTDATVEAIQAARKRLDAALAKLVKDELPVSVLRDLLKG